MNDTEMIRKMDFRPAVMQDLCPLKAMYRQIVKNMEEHGISIWDDVYPSVFLEEDIKNRRLFVLIDRGEIVSAFALCHTNEGEKAVRWKEDHAKAMYIDRLGVDIEYSRKGIGSLMLANAKKAAKKQGFQYLRLFVVDVNEPAIQLYSKNGFVKADGVFDEVVDDGFVLHEYGYEIKIESE